MLLLKHTNSNMQFHSHTCTNMSYFPLPWCENSKNCLNELLVKLIRPGPGKIKNQKNKITEIKLQVKEL